MSLHPCFTPSSRKHHTSESLVERGSVRLGNVRRASGWLAVAALLALCADTQAAQTKLAWAPNPDRDAVGYMVRYGTASGRYDRSVDVGGATSATVTNLTVGGMYYFAVTAYNGARLESLPSNEVAIRIESLAPSVALTTPIEGAVIQVGTKLNIAAVASDQDGSISKVEFYQGNQKIGEDVSAPYSIEWQVRKVGEVKLSARAVGNDGSRKVSEPVFISIRTANAPFTKGAYAGMIATPDEDVRYAGAFTLNTSATGVFTGSLKWNGVSYRLKGRLDGAGAATITIPRKNQTPSLPTPTISTRRGEAKNPVDNEPQIPAIP